MLQQTVATIRANSYVLHTISAMASEFDVRPAALKTTTLTEKHVCAICAVNVPTNFVEAEQAFDINVGHDQWRRLHEYLCNPVPSQLT